MNLQMIFLFMTYLHISFYTKIRKSTVSHMYQMYFLLVARKVLSIYMTSEGFVFVFQPQWPPLMMGPVWELSLLLLFALSLSSSLSLLSSLSVDECRIRTQTCAPTQGQQPPETASVDRKRGQNLQWKFTQQYSHNKWSIIHSI